MWTTEDAAAAAAQVPHNGRRELGASPTPEWASERLLPLQSPLFKTDYTGTANVTSEETFVNKGGLTERCL